MTASTPHRPGPLDAPFAQTVRALLIIGACLNFLLLCGYCYLRWHPISRPHLNRVSLRLLVYSQVANVIFCIILAVGVNLRAGPTPWCSVIDTLVYLTSMFSALIFFCMALNLQLVLVHGVNGRMMEKYYVFGSSILALVCNITPLAAGQFGWNDVGHSCWFSDPDPAVRMRWLIGTQSFWVLSTAFGEVLVFLVIIGYIISQKVAIRRALRDHAEKSGNSTHSTPTGDWTMPSETPIGQYRNIILRISLYPLVSCLTNFSTRLLDLWQAKLQAGDPVITEALWRMNVADAAIYALRPVLYFCLAASDPAFIRGIQALRRAGLETTTREHWSWGVDLRTVGTGSGQTVTESSDLGAAETRPFKGPCAGPPPLMLPKRSGAFSRGASIEVVDVGSHI